MKKTLWLVLLIPQLGSAWGRAPGGPSSIELTGRLIDLALEAPDCGTFRFHSLTAYDQVEGAGLPGKVFVAHGCIELPRRRYAKAAGNLERFVIGERHRLKVRKASAQEQGSLVRGAVDPGDAPIYLALKADLVIPVEVTPRSLGDLRLDRIEGFPPQLREAARAVSQAVGAPADYTAQVSLDRTANELVFHLWHRDAFLPKNRGVVGNPGGKCRDVRYGRGERKVTRTLFWQ